MEQRKIDLLYCTNPRDYWSVESKYVCFVFASFLSSCVVTNTWTF